MKVEKLVLFVIILFILSSCHVVFYSEHIHDDLQDTRAGRIGNENKFLVFPIRKINFEPPNSCLGPETSLSSTDVELRWNKKIKEYLLENFPNQKWSFIEKNDPTLRDKKTSYSKIKMLCEDASVVSKIQSMNKPDHVFQKLPVDEEMRAMLNDYSQQFEGDYAIIFIDPSLVGDIQTNTTYSANGGFSQSSQTYYTAQFEIQLWDCNSGQLLYNSGVHQRESGFCIFISPEDAAISQSSTDFTDRLSHVVESLIKKNR